MTRINVRTAVESDSKALCALLNKIIEIGGSTAFQAPLDAVDFSGYFLNGSDYLSCFVAVDDQNSVLGFQSLTRHSKLPADWADIATFSRVEPKVDGVGTALFESTVQQAHSIGVVTINATIRADNTSGLAFYNKMGFVNYAVDKTVPLSDGILVDRISKRYDACRPSP